jgi:hypothetical protein
LTTTKWRNSGRDVSKTGPRETEKIQIRLATTRNKNEQQQDVKNNSEIWIKWTNTIGKNFVENIGRDRTDKALTSYLWWWWW